jgi:LacI family transcriptional regulator
MLEHRFQKLAGRTPHAEIIRLRVERVARLLRETDLTLDEIAARTGFPHAEYLSVVFKRRQGAAPGVYRRQLRTGTKPAV